MATPEAFELSSRQRHVLYALCRHYVLTAQPVSSGALSRRYGIRWSSATIRSELAVLEQAGYVMQPHTAAGRAPTALGLREFVASFESDRAPRDEHRRLVDLSVADAGGPRDGVAMTTRVLAELAGCVAIGFVGAPRADELSSLRLVLTAPGRALAVLGFSDGRSAMYRVDFDPEFSPRLTGIEHRLAALTVGRTLEEAREHLEHLLADCERQVDAELAEVARVGLLMCTAGLFDPLWLSVLGQPHLARDLTRNWVRGGTKDAAASDRLGALLGLLEDYQRLADFLCQILPGTSMGADVRLGLGFEGLGATGLSLIGCRFDAGGAGRDANRADAPNDDATAGHGLGAATGVLAVLGSPSMDYESVIPLVEYAARALSTRSGHSHDA